MDKTTVIEPPKGLLNINIKEILDYKELFYVLAWRDIKVRYKQTILGVLWVVLQPLISTFIFTVFFGRFAKIPSGELPYSLFVLIGLVFWGFFSSILSRSSTSLIENENIVKKVYFPRIILPFSTVVTSFVDFLVSFVLLMIVALYFGFIPNLMILIVIPLGLIVGALGAAGLGLFLSSFNVKYRDVRYILPFFIQTLIFLTPVIYPTEIVSENYRNLLALNPMTGVILAVRNLFSELPVNWELFGVSALSAIIFFLSGLYYFRRTERFFADLM